MEMVSISRREFEEYEQLKKLDFELIGQFVRSLEDLRLGRVERVR